jgi:hypothetical protein
VALSNEALKEIIREFRGLELSDDELDLIRPALDAYIGEIERLQDLDLTQVMSARLLRAQEGGRS